MDNNTDNKKAERDFVLKLIIERLERTRMKLRGSAQLEVINTIDMLKDFMNSDL